MVLKNLCKIVIGMEGEKEENGAGVVENQEGFQVAQADGFTFKTRPLGKTESNYLRVAMELGEVGEKINLLERIEGRGSVLKEARYC